MFVPGSARVAIIALALGVVLPHRAVAQGARVSGEVFDSTSHTPLAGASVQLVSAKGAGSFSTAVFSDSLGRFVISGVPDGSYTIGFFHPVLDSLFIEATLHEVVVTAGRSVAIDLATPSGTRLRTAICGARNSSDSSALIMGGVREAESGAPVAGAHVSADWMDLAIGAGGVQGTRRHFVATTGENGFYAICNTPAGGEVVLMATRAEDSTSAVPVQVPSAGFVRRELAMGSGKRADGKLSGTVVTSPEGAPVVNAEVRVGNAPPTRTNDRGEWRLTDIPSGTRTLDVRAVTFYPARQAVNVVPDAPPVRVSLTLLKHVLDTIRVSATRYSAEAAAFDERKRSGVGHYVTAQDIKRRQAQYISDILRMTPGLSVEGTAIHMRGVFKETVYGDGLAQCTPVVFFNGMAVPDADTRDVDSFAPISQVRGIEVYQAGAVPIQFQSSPIGVGQLPCGVIVIWTVGR